MHKVIELCLVMLLVTGCSAYNKTTVPSARLALSDSAGLTDSEKRERIPLELTTHLGDQQRFVEGDEIQFLLSLGHDAYIYMYYIDAVNNITQILPNENQQTNFYTAGYFLTIPEYKNLYRFTISEPFGNESIWVFASDRSITMKPSPGSIENIKQRIKKSSDKAYGEYVLNIVTGRQDKTDH